VISTVVTHQFERLLEGLSATDPWPELAESGFLDMLRSDVDGGSGLPLEELFPLALVTGGRLHCPPVLETMIARLADSNALNIVDAENALAGLPAARPLAAALAAAQMAGAMERIQRMTLEYATTRRQFGREIGKFQVVQHHIAVMAEEVIAARIAAEAALQGAPLQISELRAGVAKIRVGEAAQLVSSIAHAVHGAIGVSEEHVLHHYTRRLRIWQMAHGGESWWATRLGESALSSTADMAVFVRGL
jgi:acyl-CoA dehydrogenase